jgi:hypothetical protein
MSEQQPMNSSNDYRYERRMRHPASPWVGGIVLIMIGGILLLQNMNFAIPYLKNWWALFILIPAVGSLANAYSAYRYTGRLDDRARGALIGGGFLTVLAFALMFDISSALIWPMILILGGVSLLVQTMFRDS